MDYEHILEQRLKFLDCDDETHRHLDEFRDLLAPELDGFLDYFYQKILSVPELNQLFLTQESADAARAAQRNHWLNVLFSHNFGTAHYENSSRIGAAHERVGLTISWYINSYCLMLNKFVRLAADYNHGDVKKVTRMIQEINKTVFLDMHYVIEAYLNAKDEALRRVLTRAEGFAAEIRQIDDSLGEQARGLHSQLASVAARLESDEDSSGVRRDVADAVKEADDLAERIDGLKQELELMQRRHKLQYVPARKQGFLDKVKRLFKS